MITQLVVYDVWCALQADAQLSADVMTDKCKACLSSTMDKRNIKMEDASKVAEKRAIFEECIKAGDCDDPHKVSSSAWQATAGTIG